MLNAFLLRVIVRDLQQKFVEIDAETGELLELDSKREAVREKFFKTNADRLAELDRALQRAGVDTLRFDTTQPFAQTLQHFFETRRGRRRG